MIQWMSLDHVKYYVMDLEKVSNFYVNKLGFQVVKSSPEWRMVVGGGITIDLETPADSNKMKDEKIASPQGRHGHKPGHTHTAFRVADVEKSYEELKSKGVEFFMKPFTNQNSKRTIAFFTDPEGNVFHITD